ncbi:hypothetical protein COCMIDRAFT_4351 [Bipolaris oryzae ATCC 44560]|uniref:Thioesterase domain-containing protein n=1 Tax=Bipolaris oryzae ATCC 44560 TaxID=930090 RepID=W6Z965_COCMI|nr:uncharacterized protein COCMIDRAFT_4351 [Bipolaris oryzae ATCC 44560]EUC46575.1 hypothetical protein COCMIDRAFT_4351 [Bipolaris oryzae ATCC 44560]
MMTATSEHLQAFAPLSWATPYLTSPKWMVCDRERGSEPGEDTDRFCRDTMRANHGVQHWVELHEQPSNPGGKITKSISLVKFGTGLNGFPGICHGGALFTLMDEAMCYIVVANTVVEHGVAFMKAGEEQWRLQLFHGKLAQEILKGRLVTANMDTRVLAPVLCPGIVGIETDVLEDKGNKMRIRAIMRDRQGKPVVQTEGLWVRVGGAANL